MRLLDKKLSDTDDRETLSLIRELHLVTGVHPAQYADSQIFHYLQQCLYPNGSAEPVKITRDCINKVDDLGEFIIWKKVGKVGDGLNRLLRGFTDGQGDNLENHYGTAIYMFLNRMLVPTKKKVPKRYFR